MSEATLARFFVSMRPFLAGEVAAVALVDSLGPSASGMARLALYPKLVARQRRDILDGLFPAVRTGCGLLREGLWDDLTRDFVLAHPPGHWEPNHLGAPFSEFLAARRDADGSLPAWLEELADYAWIRFAVTVASAERDDDGVGLDRSLFARRYTYDVIAFTTQTQAAGRPASRPLAPPKATPRTVLVGWSLAPGGGVVVVDASRAALVAIQRRGRDLSRNAASGLTEAQIAAAEDDLVRRGLLARRP